MTSKPFPITVAPRVLRLPPYVFTRINKLNDQKRAAGIDIIDLGMGNPTDPPAKAVIDKLAETAAHPGNHRYSASNGVAVLRREAAAKYARNYNAALDADTEIITTIGSKEGFSHLCLALLGPGDTAIVPEPAFPAHIHAIALAGANVIRLPLGNDQVFLDRVEQTIGSIFPAPKLIVLNFPHNPTAMTIDADFWPRAIDICRRHGVMIISDFAYGEVCFDGYKAPSFLSAPGAKEIGVEFTTMSKSYNMAGWRCGFCAGNAEMVKALATIKGYYDYGLFAPIQLASAVALHELPNFPAEQAKVYEKRRDAVCRGLDRLGWAYEKPRASMFVWARIKPSHFHAKEDTLTFCLRMVDEAEVSLAPGSAFGESGEGFVRIALVETEERLTRAMEKLKQRLTAPARAPQMA